MEVCNNFVRETNSYQSAGITFCRVVFTIAIVLCHIAEPTNFIKVGNVLNIGVQVFFVISGFLYGRKVINGIKDFYIKRIKKIYLPYLIFVSLALIAYYLFHKDYLSYDKVLLYLFNLQAFTTIKGLGHTWFVTSIMLCYLITPLLQKISQYAHPVIWCILSFFIQFIDVQFLGMRSMYLFLYCAAYFLAKLDFKHFNIIGISAILIWVLLVLICGNDNLDWEGHRSIWGHFHYLGGGIIILFLSNNFRFAQNKQIAFCSI